MAGKLAWGILGTGSIAKAFAKALGQCATGHLVAVGSRSQASADEFAKTFSAPKAYSSYEALLADKDVQAVYISLPNHLHAEWSIKCAQAGKHILCEKPLASNHGEAMAIIEAARYHDVFFMEAFMYRCHPVTAKIVELIREGVIGQVRVIQANFGFDMAPNYDNTRLQNHASGGGIMDVGCYAMSMARLIAGAAIGQEVAEPVEVKGAAHVGSISRVDEWATASVKFPNDILATLACGVHCNLHNIVRVFGSDGWLEVPSPWFCAREANEPAKIIVKRKDATEPREYTAAADATLYAHEANTVARFLSKRQAASPSMTWADTLGQQKAIDLWRKGVGVVFDRELPGSAGLAMPFSNQPLKRRADASMAYAKVPGIDKPVAKAVMGTVAFHGGDQAYANALLDHYFELGGNCIDTAHIYGGGRCEAAVGHWLKARNNRDQIVLISKGGHTPNNNLEAVRKQIVESLDRLCTDYADIYMLHRDNTNIPAGEWIDLLNELKSAGRLRTLGTSNWTAARMDEANEYAKKNNKTPFVASSNNLALAVWNEPMWGGCLSVSDAEGRAWHTKNQMPLFSWSSQASGFFTGRYKREDANNPAYRDVVRTWFSDDNFKRLDRARELGAKKGVTATQIAMAYVLNQPFPAFALIGTATIDETRTSVEGVSLKLTADELRWLNLEI